MKTDRTSRLAGLAAPLLVAALVAACSGGGAADPSPPPVTDAPAPTATAGSGAVPDEVLQPILAAAANEAGVDRDALVIVRAERVTWSDTSLGCPNPDEMYAQVLVDGYWVVIEAGGTTLDYRVNDSGEFRRCENPS